MGMVNPEMKVLFISSGNSEYYRIAPFIRAQGDSLEHENISIAYFSIMGKGLVNYFKNIFKLRNHLKQHSYDLIHAHYSLCGWVAVLSLTNIPIVLSLMGDDAIGTYVGKNKMDIKSRIIILFTQIIQYFVHAIISKSKNIDRIIRRKNIAYVIPNGVNMKQFDIKNRDYRKELKLREDKQYVLFLADPSDPNKNVDLVKDALTFLQRKDADLKIVYQVPHAEIVKYFNAVDAFVLCSFSEGSPNVVKEAMACGVPMVVTDVGDTSYVLGEVDGCYISAHLPEAFALKLEKALHYSKEKGRTSGRNRIFELGLDEKTIALKIKGIYQSLLKTSSKPKEECVEFPVS